MNKISVHDRAICLCFVYSLPLPVAKVAKYCSAHVCVSVSLLRVSNCVSKRRQSYACCLWSWICPYLNTFLFQFCGRRVFTQWSDTGDMVHAHGQSDRPGSSSGARGGSDGESHDAQSEVWLSNKFLLSVIGHLGW